MFVSGAVARPTLHSPPRRGGLRERRRGRGGAARRRCAGRGGAGERSLQAGARACVAGASGSSSGLTPAWSALRAVLERTLESARFAPGSPHPFLSGHRRQKRAATHQTRIAQAVHTAVQRPCVMVRCVWGEWYFVDRCGPQCRSTIANCRGAGGGQRGTSRRRRRTLHGLEHHHEPIILYFAIYSCRYSTAQSWRWGRSRRLGVVQIAPERAACSGKLLSAFYGRFRPCWTSQGRVQPMRQRALRRS